MARRNWREVWKFLSGVAFAASLANFYLFANGVAVPFFGHLIEPRVLGIRAAVQFGFFLLFFYLGYLRKPSG